jgi:hypothetical protein
VNEYFSGRRVQTAQDGAEIFIGDLAGEAQLLSTAPEPFSDDPLLL